MQGRAGQGRREDMTGWDEIQLSANQLNLSLNCNRCSCRHSSGSRSKSRPLLVGHLLNRAYIKFVAFPAALISFLIYSVCGTQFVFSLIAAVSYE